MTGEFVTIDRLGRFLPPMPPDASRRGEVWIGDDAAVITTPEAPWLLLATDAVVAGVHADLSLTTMSDLGWKALTCNLSDLAAMGGSPGYALVTVAGPPDADLGALYEGIADASGAFACPVVGGDLTNAPALVVSVAVTGTSLSAPVRRSGAQEGDAIWVTGPLGASAAGLRLLRAGAGLASPVVGDEWVPADGAAGAGAPPGAAAPSPPPTATAAEAAALKSAHARPVPRLAEGRAAAAAGATAMIDVSDGLGAELGHIADASGVGFDIDDVPVAPGATWEEALGGGEDYELVFCAPDAARVRGAFARLRPPVLIGRCTGSGEHRRLAGRPLPPQGWQHRW